jgi:hypothetical protein
MQRLEIGAEPVDGSGIAAGELTGAVGSYVAVLEHGAGKPDGVRRFTAHHHMEDVGELLQTR